MPSVPRVTVFIPAYNRQDYIGLAIDSILQQDFTDLEVLVVDDGSTDSTPEVVESYAAPRVRLERSPRGHSRGPQAWPAPAVNISPCSTAMTFPIPGASAARWRFSIATPVSLRWGAGAR